MSLVIHEITFARKTDKQQNMKRFAKNNLVRIIEGAKGAD